jgi:hypothetical protein
LASEPFTRGDVDYLVSKAKFIRTIPVLPVYDPSRTVTIIQAEVLEKAKSKKALKGLIIMAKARHSPTGIPKPLPSSALVWYSRRIRGLNYELWHDNPDGSIVRGWHEHLWSPEQGDEHVVAARPEPTRRGLLDVFRWGLKKWNIEVLEDQEGLWEQ